MIAGLYKGEMRVYKINEDKTCSETNSVGFRTSKATFSYSDSDFSDRLITFYYDRIFDRNEAADSVSGRSLSDGTYINEVLNEDGEVIDSFLGDNKGPVQLSVFTLRTNEMIDVERTFSYSFPNLTKDGRLIFIDDEVLKIIDLNSFAGGKIGGDGCVSPEYLESIYSDELKI